MIGINAARVELADFNGRRGCISLNFIDVSKGEALIHGNEVLAVSVTGYDKTKRLRQADHTLDNIQLAIERLSSFADTNRVLSELASYLVLDALIGNTDRHHENWGLRRSPPKSLSSQTLQAAPSFDHASSLGRELSDPKRLELISRGMVEQYVFKGRGGIFRDSEQKHGENPLRLVQVAARAYPEFFRPALEQLKAVHCSALFEVIDRLPQQLVSEPGRLFAKELMGFSHGILLESMKQEIKK